MGLFTKHTDVEGKLHEIERLLELKDVEKIPVLLKEIREYVEFVVDDHKDTLSSEEVAHLEKVIEILKELQKSYLDPTEYNEMKTHLLSVFSNTNVYLMRHTDKPTEKTSSWSPLAVLKKLGVAKSGVTQAKKFARSLTEEVLMCPKPVNVIFNYSDMPRTKIYAEIIRRTLVRAARKYGKQINILKMQDHKDLYFRWSKDALEETKEDISKIGEYKTFRKWIKGEYKTLPDKDVVAQEIGQWVKRGLQQPSNDAWTIVIGIGHSYNIDSYLYTRVNHNHLIHTADYAKFVGNTIYYEEKWYSQ